METENNLHFRDRANRLLEFLDDQYQVGSFGKIQEIRKLCEDIIRQGIDYDFSADWHPAQYQAALEFLTVCEFYRSNNIVLHRGLMRKICSGHLAAPNETKISQDRDFFLEIKVARYFLAAGFEIDLTGDVDLLAKKFNAEIYVECKRLWSEGNAEKQIKKARKQIENRLRSAPKKSAGWIYVDASHLINEGKIPYPCRNPLAPIHAMQMELRFLFHDLANSVKSIKKGGPTFLILTSNWAAIDPTEKTARPMTTTVAFCLKRWAARWNKKAALQLGEAAQIIDFQASSAMMKK